MTMALSNSKLYDNKIIPTIILNEARIALSHYPELDNVSIEFKFKPSLRQSVMKAQPKLNSVFKAKNRRAYVILMSKTFTLDGTTLHLKDIPKNVLIGWLGHELGHIMDYKERSTLNLIFFGLKYFLSGNYIRKAERIADSYAVQSGMKDYILDTKSFILNHSDLSEKYKARIKRLYVSPNEILNIVKEQQAN